MSTADFSNFNPRAPCGARPICKIEQHMGLTISIHAPLAGRDSAAPGIGRAPWAHFNPRAPCGARPETSIWIWGDTYFNPRAPCGARLWYIVTELGSIIEFQSTRPLRGATRPGSRDCRAEGFQSTRPLRGATASAWPTRPQPRFQSTRPLRGATRPQRPRKALCPNFNPRAPCGARHAPAAHAAGGCDFNPRAPCGARRRGRHPGAGRGTGISIHAPLAGRDWQWRDIRDRIGCDFNPRAPCGARQPAKLRA